ncbi:hypothetical protein EPJ66_05685 [Brachyspira aalborgi]|uniref:Uncharacterized protein n=1 Tax=Brachyspira aalborgi TaxID=29522 RepID=A0A5C8EH72_9SPIR|nr:hypothetical protein [Brachyspira aalborgi]TXJ36808.1 hypothetical protein EPJ81_10770 [Brachyspira aalborgi]TXJ52740.1 hypothetical protein EPJ66_05685 [Brachyspira aalborgi]
MKKVIYLIFLSLFLVSCDFTTSKNPETSWIKSVKGKTFADDEGISFIFDANGNCSIKITEDTSNDFWSELGKLAVESIQFTYIKAINKNRAVYSMKILFMTAYYGLKLDKNKLFMTIEEPAEMPEDINWDELEYIASKK